jgi:hypothetical protein
MQRSWPRIAAEAWLLGFEAAGVVGLRALALAAGDAAAKREAQRMIEEKATAAFELHARAWRGAFGLSPPLTPRKTLAHYRRKVRANRRRLTGRKPK